MNCEQCGANLGVEDMKRLTCRFCNTVLPHTAKAAEQIKRETTLEEAVAIDALQLDTSSEEIHERLADPERSKRKMRIILGCIATILVAPWVFVLIGWLLAE